MRVDRFLVVAALAAGLSLPALPAPALSGEHFDLSGHDVVIYDLVGQVKVISGTGSSVGIDMVRGGADAARLSVKQLTVDGRQALVVVFPDDHIVYKQEGLWGSTEMRVADDGTWGKGRPRERSVHISGGGSGLEASADLTVSVPAGRSVTVMNGVGGLTAEGVSAQLVLDTSAAAVSAKAIKGDLTIDVGSGSVTVDGVDGNVSVDTGSGSVRLSAVRGADLAVDSGSGSVRGADLSAASLLVDTGSGAIELKGVTTRKAKLDTGSGSVGLDLIADLDTLLIDTGSGHVDVAVPPALGADFDLDTGSGGIHVDVPATNVHKHDSSMTGRLGDGQGHIHIDTGSGAIRLLSGD